MSHGKADGFATCCSSTATRNGLVRLPNGLASVHSTCCEVRYWIVTSTSSQQLASDDSSETVNSIGSTPPNLPENCWLSSVMTGPTLPSVTWLEFWLVSFSWTFPALFV